MQNKWLQFVLPIGLPTSSPSGFASLHPTSQASGTIPKLPKVYLKTCSAIWLPPCQEAGSIFPLISSWLTSGMFSPYATITTTLFLLSLPHPRPKSRHNCHHSFTNSDPIAFMEWKILVIHSNKHRLQLRDIMSNSKTSYKTFPIHLTWQTLYAKGRYFHTRCFSLLCVCVFLTCLPHPTKGHKSYFLWVLLGVGAKNLALNWVPIKGLLLSL